MSSQHQQVTKSISSFTEALAFIDRKVDDGETVPKIIFDGQLKTLTIEIEGPTFKGELTGEVARGLAEFQDEIYRSIRYALSEHEGRDVRLTSQQKDAVELKIEVKKGCTLVNIDLGNLGNGIVGVLNNMTAAEVTTLTVSVVTILAFGWVGGKYVVEHFKSKTAIAEDAGEVKRLEAAVDANVKIVEKLTEVIGRDKRVERFAEAAATGMREIASNATGATSVKIGQVELDEDELMAMRRRAPRSKSEQIKETGDFRILHVDGTTSPFKLTISGAVIDGEFTVEFDESDFDKTQTDAVWNAVRTRSTVELSVTAVQIKGKTKGAVLLDINPSLTQS